MTAWDETAARHILSRTLFGYNLQDIEFALSMTLDEFVDNHLLADKPEPASPGFWVNDTSSDNRTERTRELINWWYYVMMNQGYSLRERMVLFWHNHFVSDVTKVVLPQRMYWQNKLFRDHAMGNLIEFTKAVTLDAAMLIYLDGISNRKGAPNENYARELMELFTLGIGNYTETDIQEAARALTGWRVEGLTPYFTQSRFDDGDKTFMNQTGNFTHTEIVDIIFSQPAAAMYFCRELYSEFVHVVPDETNVEIMAEILRSNNYELKPVLSTLFKSVLFHSDEIRAAKIKNPVEFILATMKQFNISTPDYSYMRSVASQLRQELFSPPNVSGWDGDKTWINTTTLPARNIYTDAIVTGNKPGGGNFTFEIDLVEYARTFPEPENAVQLIDDIARIFIQFPLSENRKAYLLNTLLDGAEVYDWSTSDPKAEDRLKLFFKALMRLSEYQLT
ncbi:MAG: DUF1800 domain-containing protein [Ignavibacteriales bacterium]|nr:MAG: DUF1800 domain-containing protein [Ignavibacteriales bacterium]